MHISAQMNGIKCKIACVLLLCVSISFAFHAAAESAGLWQVSGTINAEGKVTLDPLFTTPVENVQSQIVYAATFVANSTLCKGDNTLEVQDDKGKAIFICHFVVNTTILEDGIEGDRITRIPGVTIMPLPKKESTKKGTEHPFVTDKSFSILLPYMPAAAALVLKDPHNKEFARITIGGTAPKVSIISPSSGFVGKGIQKIEWKVETSQSHFTSRLQFSKDGGNEWVTQGTIGKNGTFLNTDFDKLPGSANALIRVLVSDGVNTGIATSVPFTIPRKNIIKLYISNPPENWEGKGATRISFPGQPQYTNPVVIFIGGAYSLDDNVLPDSALEWSSNLQGKLGTGGNLTAHLDPGHHIITLRATDSQGNSATMSREITILPQ